MTRTSDDEPESSLPSRALPIFPSSPPILTQLPKIIKMDADPACKSEPSFTQDAQPMRPARRRVNSDDTERPPSAQRTQDEVDGQADANAGEQTEDEDSDPAGRIEDFDWEDLHVRYHEAMNGCHNEESELMQEWESLMAYFRIWANSGLEHETGRTYSRLRTRMAYVQNAEEELEKKRNHYISVVKAFESALNLLKANGIGR
ncbi:zinc finger fyve-like protein 19 [Alternaria alternata]|nr:zinc finger fyve-like protein 19 [Alternaria alternata]